MSSVSALGRAIKLLSFVAGVCLLGVLALVASATLPGLFGYHTYTVESGSMSPALERGSVAIAAATSPNALRVGDIIAFHTSPQNPPVLHRIVQITNDNGQLGFMTQADQNQKPDTQSVALQGPGDKVLYTVPYAGYVLDFAHTTLGRILLIGLPLPTLLGMFFLPWKKAARDSAPHAETQPPAAKSAPAQLGAGRPTIEAPALQRDIFSVVQPALPRFPLEAQAGERGPYTPVLRPIGQRTSLETQAIERGLLLPAAPSQAERQPAEEAKAA